MVAEVRAGPQSERTGGPAPEAGRTRTAEWDQIDWREQEGQVRRLRQRIFKAAQEQDWAKVRNLQKLMLRSRANTLVSVRQVTQRNAGRRTAGIDGEVALTSRAGPGRGRCGCTGPRSDGRCPARSGACTCPEGIKPCEAEGPSAFP